ncbi:hypothetical protein FA95DRAFT_1292332 [Auriscalpium vulgare]|uniref:Uncharacterized protein n=1 Tax=Auriscalpium vulgare TaxID=40419 RepID=A0ACB8RTS0_9AGAM|nr:hypothetical protein FA95DRAFT_1292332 [Auriscalpium vulgare]
MGRRSFKQRFLRRPEYGNASSCGRGGLDGCYGLLTDLFICWLGVGSVIMDSHADRLGCNECNRGQALQGKRQKNKGPIIDYHVVLDSLAQRGFHLVFCSRRPSNKSTINTPP